MLVLLAALGSAEGKTLLTCGDTPTPGCYGTLGEAVADALDGDTIQVSPGAYEEAVEIDVAITIIGQPGNILLDPLDPAQENVLTVTATGRVELHELRIVTASARPISVRDGDLVLGDCTLRSTGLQYEGGLLRAEHSDLEVMASRFEDATAVYGGHIYVKDTIAAISTTTFDGGVAVVGGGSIAAVGGSRSAMSLFLVESLVDGSEAADQGGALYLDHAQAYVDETTFTGNEADEGGAIAAYGDEQLRIVDSGFVGNVARLAGAGVHSEVETTITSTLFEGNRSVEGGALWATVPRSIASNRFCGNSAQRQGSAIYGRVEGADGTLTITNNVFAGNRGEGLLPEIGGTIAVHVSADFPDGAAKVRVVQNTFLENEASAASGVDLSEAADREVEVAGNLFAGNVATGGEGGQSWVVLTDAAAHQVHHNLSWENEATGAAPSGWWTEGKTRDPALVRWDPSLCPVFAEDSTSGTDGAWPAWYGAGRDGGPAESSDPDGSRADIGAHGGPGAEPAAWDDEGDHDGYPALYDCAPGDATVHPDLEDEPYDGVDRDCDFWPDDDADRDGWGRDLDCDDADPTVSPGATDIPNDTIDQDCFGGDLNDLDGDGWPEGEGQDCDDGDSSVSPGEVRDEWNRDRNCDGLVTPLESGCATAQGGHWAALIALLVVMSRRRSQVGGLEAHRYGLQASSRSGGLPVYWLLLAAGLLFAGVARAEPDCAPLSESEFRTLVLDSQSAIDRDDVALHESIVEEVRQRIPCLTFRPSDRLWADFLVGVAIVEFSRAGDWQRPLAAALRVRPTVDRGVGSGHPMARWDPEPVTAPPGGAVPFGETLYVDGQPATELPPAVGLYLVQREREGIYVSRLIADEAVPADWLAVPIRVPVELALWALASVRIGPVTDQQTVSWASDYVLDTRRGGLVPGVDARGGATYGRLAAEIGYTISLRKAGDLAAQRAHVALLARSGPQWKAGGGLGFTSATVFEGDKDRTILRDVVVPLGYGVVEKRKGDPDTRFDTSFRLGIGRSVGRMEYRVGWAGKKSSTLRYGLEIGAQLAAFHQTRAPPENDATAVTMYAMFDLGFAGGEAW